jgi:hypothetical protein
LYFPLQVDARHVRFAAEEFNGSPSTWQGHSREATVVVCRRGVVATSARQTDEPVRVQIDPLQIG